MREPKYEFTKLTAAGNDFVCFDNTGGAYTALLASPALPEFIRRVCRRGLGVGADGVIFASRCASHPQAHVEARFLEPDGSEAELCGNGTACFTQWVGDTGLVTTPEVVIATVAGTARGKRLPGLPPGRVRVCIPEPRQLQLRVPVEVAGQVQELATVITGVPHAVLYVEGLEGCDVAGLGRLIRWHPAFQPRGINVNFTQVLEPGHIAVRTFEFGVEAETLACGTGSASAAIVSVLRLGWKGQYCCGGAPVLVDVRGGETLKVWFELQADHSVAGVCLETRVRTVYTATLAAEFLPAG